MKKWTIIALLALVVVILALRGIPFLINVYLNQNADSIVSNMITRTSGFENHHVSFGHIKLDYNYAGTYLDIEDIKIKPTQDLRSDQASFDLLLSHAKITGFKWKNFLFNNTIAIDSANLENLQVKSVTPPIDSLNLESSTEKRERKDYDMIAANQIILHNFNLENKDLYSDSIRLNIENLSVNVENFQFTKEDLADPNALFGVKNIHGQIAEVALHFDEFRQTVAIKGLSFDTQDQGLAIEDFSVINKFEKFPYTQSFKLRKPWLQLKEGKMDITGMNFEAFLKRGIIEIDRLKISQIHLEVFNNKKIPEDMERRPAMVHEIFQTINVPMTIRNTILKNGYLRIEEQPEKNTPRTAHLFFSNLNAEISELSNLENGQESNELSLKADALLMGKGKINLDLNYALDDSLGNFHLRGTLGPMALKEVNTMIEPEAKISLKAGMINRLDFNIYANDYDGHGEVIVRYDDLEIELLNEDYQKDKNILRRIGSFLASKVIIKSQNPKKNGELRKGPVYAKRVKHKSMFYYWWQLVLSGLKSTVTGEELEELKAKEVQKS